MFGLGLVTSAPGPLVPTLVSHSLVKTGRESTGITEEVTDWHSDSHRKYEAPELGPSHDIFLSFSNPSHFYVCNLIHIYYSVVQILIYFVFWNFGEGRVSGFRLSLASGSQTIASIV